MGAQLTAVLKRERPNLIVFTGDLVDNPQYVRKAKTWLEDLCTACEIEMNEGLLVVPGNHDSRILGNIGFRPLTQRYFWKHFKGWRCPLKFIRVSADLEIGFLQIDSNPLMWGWARGKVGWREMRKLRSAIQALSSADQLRFRNALKIALVHHHPLPVPYAGPDTFLYLKDAQGLLQFLAEKDVDMVLHGHKHHATYSLLSVATCVTDNRVIEVLGAGAAVKNKDYDPRGHNFNLICIESEGLRYVRQFFAAPQREFTEPPQYGYPLQAFERAYYRAGKKRGYRFRSLHWDMRIDNEGDRFNELSYAGFAAGDGTQFPLRLRPPAYTVDTGHLSGVKLNPEKTTPGIYLEEVLETKTPRFLEFDVCAPDRPQEGESLRFAIQSWDLNACSLNLAEFAKKFPTRQPRREWEEKHIQAAIDNFYWTISFPSELQFQSPPVFEVWPPDAPSKHEWLTKVLKDCFHYSPELHTAVLSIHKPPAEFLYRIYWYPREASVDSIPQRPELRVQVDMFVRDALGLARSRQSDRPAPVHKVEDLNGVLSAFALMVVNKVEEVSQTKGRIKLGKIEVSLMVDDVLSPGTPMLRVVAAVGPEVENIWDFTLEEGDGNAGRAYKKNVLRCYDCKIPDPKQHTYVSRPGQAQHKILYSMPLRHPEDNRLIYGVLSVGCFDDFRSGFLRQLNNREGHLWLLETAQKYVLPRVREIF